MAISNTFIDELTREAATTRRVLERVPQDKLSWRPHAKSWSLGELSLHIAQLPGAIANLITSLKLDVPNFSQGEAKSTAELFTALDESLGIAKSKLAGWTDADLMADWTLSVGGKNIMTLPRIAVIRSIMLNHWYHHRGQLSVYLRLLDIAVPSIYGPSADENPFG